METWELAAREMVRDTILRYAHLADRGRIDEVIELFVEDATLEAGNAPAARGRDALRAFFLATGARLAAATSRRSSATTSRTSSSPSRGAMRRARSRTSSP